MSRGKMGGRGWTSLSVGPSLALLAGLGCSIPIPDASYIHETRLVSLGAEVAEFGPLYPERAQPPFGIGEGPVSEFMPGDRARLRAVVVDTQGRPLEAGEVDSSWMLCGSACFTNGDLAQDLDEIECDAVEALTTSSRCRLGAGDSEFEMVIPALDQGAATRRTVWVYSVLAWGGRTAEDCWETRKQRSGVFERCAFIFHPLHLGPDWVLSLHAEEQGLEPRVPVSKIPAPALGQPVNRPPFIDGYDVYVDGAPEAAVAQAEWDPGSAPPVPVSPGSSIEVSVVLDEDRQLLQSYFTVLDEFTHVFTLTPEFVVLRHYTTGAITTPLVALGLATVPALSSSVTLEVDAHAEPGVSRVLLVSQDDRGGEGVHWLEFEVVE